jgi:hypothetical protein
MPKIADFLAQKRKNNKTFYHYDDSRISLQSNHTFVHHLNPERKRVFKAVGNCQRRLFLKVGYIDYIDMFVD